MPDETEAASLQEELALRMWDGDESVRAELLMQWFVPLEMWLRGEFPTLTDTEREDVAAEAVRRFWSWRERYDPENSKIQTVLFRIARRVAQDYRGGKLNWQKAASLERPIESDWVDRAVMHPEDDEVPAGESNELKKLVAKAFGDLPELQQDILRAYADANALDYDLDAGQLGIELGHKHKDGVPIPAVTIRVNKSRAKEQIVNAVKKRFDLKGMGYLDE